MILPDDAQAKLCSKHGIAHIINNAYGVQSASLCQLVTAACRKGRVDAVVQSTDKNFMVRCTVAACLTRQIVVVYIAIIYLCVVAFPSSRSSGCCTQVPVGGAIVAAPRSNTQLVEAVNKVYPGRASASPSLDLFMTLLYWGAEGEQAFQGCKML